jgi:hypothetical protein
MTQEKSAIPRFHHKAGFTTPSRLDPHFLHFSDADGFPVGRNFRIRRGT